MSSIFRMEIDIESSDRFGIGHGVLRAAVPVLSCSAGE